MTKKKRNPHISIPMVLAVLFLCTGCSTICKTGPESESSDTAAAVTGQAAENAASESIFESNETASAAKADHDANTDTAYENTLPDPDALPSETDAEADAETEHSAGNDALPEPDANDYVRVLDYIPDIVVDLKYATADNFTGQVIYDFTDAYLRYGTVLKLQAAQEQCKELGYYIKIWDAYRPFYAQEKLWEVYPDATYVANPAKGMSGHNLGGTIDITLVYLDGTEVPMPTGFDDFSTLADRDYSEIEEPAKSNAQLLQDIMYENGFIGYQGEWWDFSDTTSYPADDFIPPASES